MATIEENKAIIHARALELDAIVAQYRAAKTAIEAAEREIRQLRPFSEPSGAYQERLALVALDQMAKPSIDADPTIAGLAVIAWGEPVVEGE